ASRVVTCRRASVAGPDYTFAITQLAVDHPAKGSRKVKSRNRSRRPADSKPCNNECRKLAKRTFCVASQPQRRGFDPYFSHESLQRKKTNGPLHQVLLSRRLDLLISGLCYHFLLNVAITDFAESMVTTQVPVPVQSPLQPAKLKFGDGIGVSVTTVPTMYDSEQSVPQLMPGGVLVTSPFPRVLTV